MTCVLSIKILLMSFVYFIFDISSVELYGYLQILFLLCGGHIEC
jgi:hypothetical protein